MNSELIVLIVQVVILVGSYFVGRYIMPSVPKETIYDVTAKIELIVNYADKFVSWARWFMKNSTGPEKMEEVVKKLKAVADRYDLDISDDEIAAIAQKAYDQMKAGIKDAENQKIIAEATAMQAQQPIVVGGDIIQTTGSVITEEAKRDTE